MSDITGTIRAMEVKQVVSDVFKRRGVSPGLYGFRKGRLGVLVGSRQVYINVPRGLSYYDVKALTEKIERICNDIERAQTHVGQVDLEEAISSSTPA